jgi:TonB family protein
MARGTSCIFENKEEPMMTKLSFILITLILFLAPTAIAQEGSEKAVISNPTQQNKISLDIKGMDVVDVLKMLAARSEMNLVIGKNVTGRVTLFLKNVDVWDAFEILLLANDLAYEKNGDIINVMTQKDYELLYGERYKDKKQVRIIKLEYAKAAELSRALTQIKTNVGKIVVDEGTDTLALFDTPDKIKEMEDFISKTDRPIETRIFSLNYALADKLLPKIQELVTKGTGSIRMDERSNKIAITDYPDKLENISKIISSFDEKPQEVLIDAQIIQLTPQDKLEMGVNWDYWIRKYFEYRTALPVNTSNALIIGTHDATTTGVPSQAGKYQAVIDILRTIADTKVLASPRIIALNNQEAKIHIGTKDAYITSTTSQGATGQTVTAQSVNFVDTGIQLLVTPTISRSGFVTMKIKPEISDSTRTNIISNGQITQIPIVTTSEAETAVTVKDGVTIIIGGLRKDKRDKTVKKVPLLGDIPGLGFLFRSTSDDVTRTELAILLTPHIISGEQTFSDFSEVPPIDGAQAKMVKGKVIIEKVNSAQIKEQLSKKNAAYYNLISDKIKGMAYFEPAKGEKGEVKVAFTVVSSGNLKDEPRIISSSNKNLDKISLASVRNASPFPPLPGELAEKEEVFYINLEYK